MLWLRIHTAGGELSDNWRYFGLDDALILNINNTQAKRRFVEFKRICTYADNAYRDSTDYRCTKSSLHNISFTNDVSCDRLFFQLRLFSFGFQNVLFLALFMLAAVKEYNFVSDLIQTNCICRTKRQKFCKLQK